MQSMSLNLKKWDKSSQYDQYFLTDPNNSVRERLTMLKTEVKTYIHDWLCPWLIHLHVQQVRYNSLALFFFFF